MSNSVFQQFTDKIKVLVPKIILLAAAGAWSYSALAQQTRFLDSLENLLENSKNDTLKIRLEIQLSKKYNEGNVVKAMKYADDAINRSNNLNWTEGKMLSEKALGDCYPHVLMFEEAIKHYNNSIEESRKLNRKDIELKCLFQISETYLAAENFEKSFEYRRATIELAHQLGNIVTEYDALNLLAGGLYDTHQYKEALDYWQRALLLIENTRHKSESNNEMMLDAKARLLNNLSNGYFRLNNFDSTFYYLYYSLRLMSGTDVIQTKTRLYSTFGEVYLARQKFDSARYYCLLSVKSAQADHDLISEQYAYKLLSKTYESEQLPIQALDYYKKYDSVTDVIKNEQKTIEEAKQVMKIDFEKQTQIYDLQRLSLEKIRKHQRLALIAITFSLAVSIFVIIFIYWQLKLKNKKNKMISLQAEKLENQNEIIDKALKQKNILLKEVHHRVKNNLQIISSLLEMQTYSVTDEKAKSALQESQSRVVSMAIIHQKLYQDDILDSINFRAFADSLFSQIRGMSDNNKQKVRFINGFPDQIFEIDIAIPLGLILNELITNTFKYAKSNSGELYIKLLLNKKDEYLVMNYSDSGQGLPADFNFEETSSMGLQLVSRLSYQLGGYAEYRPENGSVFNIFFLSFRELW